MSLQARPWERLQAPVLQAPQQQNPAPCWPPAALGQWAPTVEGGSVARGSCHLLELPWVVSLGRSVVSGQLDLSENVLIALPYATRPMTGTGSHQF